MVLFPESPIPDTPNLDMLRKTAVSISDRGCRRKNNADKKLMDKRKKKAQPEIDILEITRTLRVTQRKLWNGP